MSTLKWILFTFSNVAIRTNVSSAFVDYSGIETDENSVIKIDGIISMNFGDIASTFRAEDSSRNQFNEIIRMVILISIINGFEIIFFNV